MAFLRFERDKTMRYLQYSLVGEFHFHEESFGDNHQMVKSYNPVLNTRMEKFLNKFRLTSLPDTQYIKLKDSTKICIPKVWQGTLEQWKEILEYILKDQRASHTAKNYLLASCVDNPKESKLVFIKDGAVIFKGIPYLEEYDLNMDDRLSKIRSSASTLIYALDDEDEAVRDYARTVLDDVSEEIYGKKKLYLEKNKLDPWKTYRKQWINELESRVLDLESIAAEGDEE